MTGGAAGGGERPGWAPRAAAVIVVLFLLACRPPSLRQIFTANFDEARYTLAAAVMLATGDYIVPVNLWGGARLLKPPLGYYDVVGGFALFGQSLFAARLFWLLSAGRRSWGSPGCWPAGSAPQPRARPSPWRRWRRTCTSSARR